MRHKKQAGTLEDFWKRLGREIAERRKACGFTQDEVAGLVNVDAETISRIERGAVSPSVERLFEIAAALGVGIADLLIEASPLAADRAHQVAAAMASLTDRDQKLLVDFVGLLRNR